MELVALVARYGDGTWLVRMFELAMTACLTRKLPTIVMEQA